MKAQDYKQTLVEAIQLLANAENELFTAMVNVAFSGEYREISSLHQVGEVLNLELAMFEDTPDSNLNHLSKLVKQLAETKNTLMNLNGIEEEDIEC